MQWFTWYSVFHSSTALSKILGEKARLVDLDATLEGAKAWVEAAAASRRRAIDCIVVVYGQLARWRSLEVA